MEIDNHGTKEIGIWAWSHKEAWPFLNFRVIAKYPALVAWDFLFLFRRHEHILKALAIVNVRSVAILPQGKAIVPFAKLSWDASTHPWTLCSCAWLWPMLSTEEVWVLMRAPEAS